jgi:hypothetical protein
LRMKGNIPVLPSKGSRWDAGIASISREITPYSKLGL